MSESPISNVKKPSTRPRVDDELWLALEPLLPKHHPSAKGGRPRIDDREVLRGILFVLHSGIPWEELPLKLGYGCGMTCWRRLRSWQSQGVWDKLRLCMQSRLPEYDEIDWTRACMDGTSVDRQRDSADDDEREGSRPPGYFRE